MRQMGFKLLGTGKAGRGEAEVEGLGGHTLLIRGEGEAEDLGGHTLLIWGEGEEVVSREAGGRVLSKNLCNAGVPSSRQSEYSLEDNSLGIVSNPKYFKRLPDGDFENEQYEDGNDWEKEMDDE